MELDESKLKSYDLDKAKIGDKIVIGHCYDYPLWTFDEVTIKSVSPKRGDITLSNGKRYQKDGRKIGVDRWESHYGDGFFEHTQKNIAIINSYISAMNEARYIVKLFREIEKQGYKMLYDLPEDKISVLHKTLQEIFGAEND